MTMAKNDSDLFDRLRHAGVRKQVAKTLSGIGEGASKKTVSAAHSTVAELRSLADDIERRLPGASRPTRARSAPTTRARSTPATRAPGTSARRTTTRSATRSRPATRSNAAGGNAGRSAARPARQRGGARTSKSAGAARTNDARAPRGQNKAKILASLKTGPKTASEIAKETGIGTGTVGSTLSKMATAGDVVKAERGYGLPS
jgi:predicted Rossmann fold nucleotide-binding protein DprA/Smf involved in DNA uptake